ncbi:ClpP/crotonase-like domain-containing protein [Scheffersomyces coipomensis]|uniref:ClpP/crotonase-like domain-containing protein n=1 Tax=Scheffersomyces coipomensis TaxID=1788519 RepID=UPI00315D050B
MSEGQDILYEVRGKVTIITLNLPDKLNALNGAQYNLLGKLVERADKEEDTIITLLQATGRYFSAGANVADKNLSSVDPSTLFSHEYWLANFVARNVWLTDLFHNHRKILAAAVNGPVIGLSTALLALCDLIYVKDTTKFFLLAPFANLGLVAEGASSSTLFLRLGWSKSAEALLLARPIKGEELERIGFINKSYNGQFSTTEEFNQHVHDELVSQVENLHEDSIYQNKELLKAQRDQLITSSNSREVTRGLYKWLDGIPQSRFVQMSQKERKHKF